MNLGSISADLGLSSKHLAMLPKVLSTVFIALIAIMLAQLVWKWLDGSDGANVSAMQTKPTIVKPTPPRPDYGQQVARLHLFGKANVKTKNVGTAPETTLNLRLLGVLAEPDGEGFAIISNSGQREKFYKLGDEISGGVILEAVYSDRVLIDRNLRTETLRLPKATPVALGSALLKPETVDSDDVGNQLTQVRDDLARNPSKLGQYISIAPKQSEDGNFEGFEVNPSGDNALFYELGLMDGDVVKQINGITLDSPNKGGKAIQELSRSSELSLTVSRDGTDITLFHNLD